MNSLPIYLGYKYFRSKKGAFASFTSLMAIAGLSLGVAALVIVLSVMNGFEKELQTRVLGVVPQLIIRSNDNVINYEDIMSEIDNAEKVLSTSPYIETQGLMSAKNRSRGVFVTGIMPELENSMSILPKYIVNGKLENISSKEGVVIGSWLARYLGIKVGLVCKFGRYMWYHDVLLLPENILVVELYRTSMISLTQVHQGSPV